MYQEIIPRALTNTKQQTISNKTVWYQHKDKSLDMHKLLEEFTQFFRENAEAGLDKNYVESGPHLLMQAFLQRIINGGGSINREYALGKSRVDLLIKWPHGSQRIAIELKVLRSAKTRPDGLEQTARYMDKSKATEGHLVIFDTKSKKIWEEKIYQKKEMVGGKTINVWGM